jgi:uncharacterized protein
MTHPSLRLSAEQATSDSLPAALRNWIGVLAQGLAIYVAAFVFGVLVWGAIMFGLIWLVEPRAAFDLADYGDQLPTEIRVLGSPGGLMVFGMPFTALLGIILLSLMVPRGGSPVRHYLGLRWPSLQQGLRWGLLCLAVHFGCVFLTSLLDLPLGAGRDNFSRIARVPALVPLLVLSVGLLGPIFEELLFRGFLLEGLRRSRLGYLGAIAVTSLLFAVMHSGGPVRLAETFLFAAFLAFARLRTGSTYLTALVHCVSNLVAIVVFLVFLR